MRRSLLLLLVFVCKASCLGAQKVETSQNRVITVESYDSFLNEVNTLLPEANSSLFPPNDLYEEKMATSWNSVSIIRSGAPGNEHYEMTSAEKEVPVCFVSWNDAACYANWCNRKSPLLFFNDISSDKKAAGVDHDLKSNQLFFCLIEVHAYAYEASGEGAAVDTFLGIEEIGALMATLSGLGANRPVAVREERHLSQREQVRTVQDHSNATSERSMNAELSSNTSSNLASDSTIDRESHRPATSTVLSHQPSQYPCQESHQILALVRSTALVRPVPERSIPSNVRQLSNTIHSMLGRIWPKNNFLNRRGLLSKKQAMDARFMESANAVSKNLEGTTVSLKKNDNLTLTFPVQEIKSSNDFFERRAEGSLPHILKKESPRNVSVTFAESPASLSTESTLDDSALSSSGGDLEQEITFKSPIEESAAFLTPVSFQDELTAVTLQFAKIQNRLKKVLKLLAQNDLPKSTKTAAIAANYDSIYPETRRFLQKKLAWIQADPLLQNEFAARFLATATIKLINIASKTVASEEVMSIQKEDLFCRKRTHPFNIPFELVFAKTMAEKRRGEKLNIPLRDLDDGMIVDMAKDAVDNLQELIDTFKKPFQEIGVHFHQCRIKRAERTKGIAVQKVCKIGEKNCLTDEEKADLNFSHRSSLELRKLKEATSVLDATEAKREIVTTIIQLVHSGLDAADCLVEMLARRKKVFKSPCQLSSR